jgi:hypothetical protein
MWEKDQKNMSPCSDSVGFKNLWMHVASGYIRDVHCTYTLTSVCMMKQLACAVRATFTSAGTID